jgi:hypothetical protein
MKLVLGALLAAGAAVGAVRLARPGAAPGAAMAWLAAAGLFLALVVGTDLAGQGLAAWGERLFGKSVLACLTLIPTLGALPLLAGLAALRHGATTAPAAAGGLAGVAAGGLAILAYGLFCTEDSALFVATWYTLGAGIVGLIGAGLGRAVLRW